jgi:hypothetical protein
MFNSLKIKLHSALVSRRKPDQRVFVNPYADEVKPDLNPKLNPYITSYDTKKPMSLQEMLRNRFDARPAGTEPIEKIAGFPECLREPIPVEPTFLHDMKEMFIGDVLLVASKFPKRVKKEKTLTAGQILQACENTKW